MISRDKIGLVLIFLILLVSCDLFVTDVESSYSEVVIELPSSRSLIDEISLYEVLITGKDIDDLRFIKSEGGTFNLNIPSGDGVTFVINLYNSDSSLLLYSGSVTVNLKPNEIKQLNIDVYQSVRQIVYDGNESTSGAVPTVTYYNANSTASILGNTGLLVKTGYTFSGWNTLADGSGTSYYADSTLTLSGSSVTLYAVWTDLPTYNVTYNLDGGLADQALVNFDSIQGAIVILNDGSGLTKSSYTFSGWSLVLEGDLVSSSFTMPGNSVTLYAVWTALPTYTVTYNLDGGSGTLPVDANNYIQDSLVNLNDGTGLINTGYSFTGWSLVLAGEILPSSYTIPGNNITLFAVWTPTYTVTYNLDGGSGTIPADSNNYLQGDTVTLDSGTGLTNTGYTFSGWAIESEGVVISSPYTILGNNVVLYALWSAIPVTNVSITSVDPETFYPEETYQMVVAITPADALNQNVTWNSGNVNIAIVDSSGLVTAVSAGSVIISTTSDDGNIVGSQSLSINDYIEYNYYDFTVISGTGPGINSLMSMTIKDGTLSWLYHEPGISQYEDIYRGVDYTKTVDGKIVTISTPMYSFDFSFTTSNSGTFISTGIGEEVDIFSGTFSAYNTSSNTEILSFDIESSDVIFSDKNLTIKYTGTNSFSSFIPTIYLSLGSTISPASGVAQDFTNPVDYTVTAEDGTQYIYSVEVLEAFNVTYNLDGSADTPPNDYNSYLENDVVLLESETSFTKSGYTLSGWALSSGGSVLGATYVMPANDVTLFAVWDYSDTAFYVSPDGSDANIGNSSSPFLTIQHALDEAYNIGLDNVKIAGGTYVLSSNITLKDGIKLEGGYNSADWSRDITTNVTTISASDITSVFYGSALTSPVTAIDGFVIDYTSTSSSVNVIDVSESNLILSNNIVTIVSSFNFTYYLSAYNSDVTVQNNQFRCIAFSDYSGGLYFSGTSSGLIINNVIDTENSYYESGSIFTDHTGVYDLVIRNNTINSGYTGGYRAGVIGTKSSANMGTSTATLNLTVDNNIITTDNYDMPYSVLYSSSPNVTINSFKNNVIYTLIEISNFNIFYQNDNGTKDDLGDDIVNYDIATFESNFSNAAGNITFNNFDLFNDIANKDFTFGSGESLAVTEGGLDGGDSGFAWGYTTDIDGQVRTGNGSTGWSIGAYESDAIIP